MQKNKGGFTLIELLVVVLIIGILSAVALPQYTKVVAKSRFVQMQTAGKSLKDAMEMYYLANGNYPSYWHELDISYPNCIEGGMQYMLWCDQFAVDMLDSSSKNLIFYDTHGLPDNGKNMSSVNLKSQATSQYIVWLDTSTKPGQTQCSSKISGLCKSLGY